MFSLIFTLFIVLHSKCVAQMLYETNINFRVEPGSRTCVYEKAKIGQAMEAYYQVLDGQHGDLDISFEVIDPNGVKLVSDYKKSQNSVIFELKVDGDYAFCMDNTYSMINSKLVFVYILIEDQNNEKDKEKETEVAVVDDDGKEEKEEEILEWSGLDENGKKYYLEVKDINEILSRTLKLVLKARYQLDIYGATKSRDSHMATEDVFIVDVWSGVQISLMFLVGMLQVYTIKKLFARPCDTYKSIF